MMRLRSLFAVIALVSALALPTAASASPPPATAVHNFGPNLLKDCPNPEGIALDPSGNLYAASFPAGQPSRVSSANICVVSRTGKLVDKFAVPPGNAGVTNLLGELRAEPCRRRWCR